MKKRNKIFTKLLCIALVCVMLITSMGAYSGDNIAFGSTRGTQFSTQLYLGNDQLDLFLNENTLNENDASPYILNSSTLFYHDLDAEYEVDQATCEAIYNFSILKNDKTIEVQTQGELDLIVFDNGISAYCGYLTGMSEFNGINYKIFANIDYNISENTLFASITLQPEDEIKENVYFSIGTPFVTDLMWDNIDSTIHSLEIAQNEMNAVNMIEEDTIYTYQGGAGDSHIQMDLYYSDTLKRMAVVSEFDSEATREYYLGYNYQSVTTQLKSIKSGLKRGYIKNNPSSIGTIDSFPEGKDKTDFNNFLVYLEDFLGDLNVPATLIKMLENISKVPEHSHKALGEHAYGLIKLPAGPSTNIVTYDDGPFAIPYNMTITQSGEYDYTGYTEVVYSTLCVVRESLYNPRYITDEKMDVTRIGIEMSK